MYLQASSDAPTIGAAVADSSLNLSEFSAARRIVLSMQMIMQVYGR